MIEKLTNLMVRSGAEWVLWLLFALSFLSLSVSIDKLIALRQALGRVERLVPALRKALRGDDHEAAERLLAEAKSVPGNVVLAGLAESDLGSEAAEEAMAAASGLERKRLERGLLILGTIGNNAPFVGLLGTVIGVVGAFDELGKPEAMTSALSQSASLAPERVMGTIAEALVATAVGLVVAIPVVAAFNYFQGRVNQAIADAETLGHVLLAHLRAEHDPDLEAKRERRRRSAKEAAGTASERPLSASSTLAAESSVGA